MKNLAIILAFLHWTVVAIALIGVVNIPEAHSVEDAQSTAAPAEANSKGVVPFGRENIRSRTYFQSLGNAYYDKGLVMSDSDLSNVQRVGFRNVYHSAMNTDGLKSAESVAIGRDGRVELKGSR